MCCLEGIANITSSLFFSKAYQLSLANWYKIGNKKIFTKWTLEILSSILLFLSSLLLSVVFSLLRRRHSYTYAQLGAYSQPRNCKIKLCRKRSNGTKTYENDLVERQTKQRDKKNKEITSFNKLITLLFKSLLRRLQASKVFLYHMTVWVEQKAHYL